MLSPVPNWLLEDDSLAVALTLTFGFGAVGANRSFLTTLYAAFPTGKTSGLGPHPPLGIGCRS
jgi:hypothetical protein